MRDVGSAEEALGMVVFMFLGLGIVWTGIIVYVNLPEAIAKIPIPLLGIRFFSAILWCFGIRLIWKSFPRHVKRYIPDLFS